MSRQQPAPLFADRLIEAAEENLDPHDEVSDLRQSVRFLANLFNDAAGYEPYEE